jgi:hypothetical protein
VHAALVSDQFLVGLWFTGQQQIAIEILNSNQGGQ